MIVIENYQQSLEGVSQTGAIILKNPHNLLAIMFELEAQPNFLQIQPPRGMILQQQKKTIKLRLKPQLREQAMRLANKTLMIILRTTQACQYNRKLLERHNLSGWKNISKKLQEQQLPLKLSLIEEVSRVRELGRTSSSLKHSRRQNSFEKFRDSSIKRVKDPKMNEDLDFIFRNQKYGQNARVKNRPRISEESVENSHKIARGYPVQKNQYQIQTAPSNFFKAVNNQQKVLQRAQKAQEAITKNVRFTEQRGEISSIRYNSHREVKNGQLSRNVQLIILAIVAAVCFALGENIGSIIK